jgi:hypothetical protein
LNPLAIAVVLAMALSLAGNIGLTRAYLAARDHAATAEESKQQALDATATCSSSITSLESDAKAQKAQAETAIAQAQASAKTRNRSADRILSTPASTPGNDCKSASDRATEWLKGRK